MSKKALGRGLDALISTDTAGSDELSGVVEISTDRIDSTDSQPRKQFQEETLNELAVSIREHGIIQPIIVEKHDERYTVVAGERRLRAARLAGLEKVPAIVRDYPSEQLLQIALIENIQREDLNPIEEASAYETLLNRTKLKQEELAERIGKSRVAITNSLRLLKLPRKMQEAVAQGIISAGHARAVLSVTDPAGRQKLYDTIIDKALSVRQAENVAGSFNTGGSADDKKQSKPKKRKDPDIREIEQRLLESLGTKVELKGTRNNGKIEVSYFSREDLERLIELLLGVPG